MRVCEIYKGILGEGGLAGFTAAIVRCSGCNLRCRWCDTKYAYEGGQEIGLERIMERIEGFNTRFVLLTGGEPLMQEEAYELARLILSKGYGLVVETNGSFDISPLPENSVRIVDIKPPGSGMEAAMRWENINELRIHDEVKFVIMDKADYLWAREITIKHRLLDRVSSVFFSPAYPYLDARELAEWIIADTLPIRLNLQLHRLIWGEKRGV